MFGIIAAVAFLIITLYGYFISIRMSKLEKELRQNKMPYQCFECKKEISINDLKCPHCSFITLYGKRKAKYWIILPILGVWIFLVAKFVRRGII